jgi:predicted metal-dependent phosphoesterase TrpH
MSKHVPFTTVCGRLAELARPRRADLHVHTTASDGEFTAQQVVAFARRAGLAAVAVTDHDTLAAVDVARAAAAAHLEVVPGVEITAAFAGREVHLLGYFVRTDHAPLNAVLARLCERRHERFRDFLSKLASRGYSIPADRAKLVEEVSRSLGRRHVAGLLVACGHARHRTEAFHRLLGPLAGRVLPKELIPAEEAVALVRAAGGVSSLAHPTPDLTDADFHALAGLGVDALEVEYPWGRKSPAARLREVAARLGFAVTGGSDCHGPDPARRGVGSCGVGVGELNALRERAGDRGSRGPRG